MKIARTGLIKARPDFHAFRLLKTGLWSDSSEEMLCSLAPGLKRVEAAEDGTWISCWHGTGQRPLMQDAMLCYQCCAVPNAASRMYGEMMTRAGFACL